MWPANREIPDLSELLRPASLDQIGAEILNGGPRAIRYDETRAGGTSMVFVAHHQDVVRVLMEEGDFSLCHYNPLYSTVAPGAFLIMRPEDTGRRKRLDILTAAAAQTPWFEPDPTARREMARACVDEIVAKIADPAAPRARFDLICEYGYFAPYLVAKRVIGLGSPRSFSLLPLAICLLNGHPVSRVFARETGPYFVDTVWSQVVVGQLLLNFENRRGIIRWLARHGAAHLRKQIQHDVDAPQTVGGQTLLNALKRVRKDFRDVDDKVYREHAVSIMMELVSTILLIPGQGFGGIIDRCLRPGGGGLKGLLSRLEAMKGDTEAFVQEELRLAPPAHHLLRTATRSIQLGGLTLEKGDYVCAVVKSAGADIPDDPKEVKAGRASSTYLTFGPEGAPHRCRGDRLSPSMLAEMFLGLQRLPELTPQSDAVKSRFGAVPGRLIVDVGKPVGTQS